MKKNHTKNQLANLAEKVFLFLLKIYQQIFLKKELIKKTFF